LNLQGDALPDRSLCFGLEGKMRKRKALAGLGRGLIRVYNQLWQHSLPTLVKVFLHVLTIILPKHVSIMEELQNVSSALVVFIELFLSLLFLKLYL